MDGHVGEEGAAQIVSSRRGSTSASGSMWIATFQRQHQQQTRSAANAIAAWQRTLASRQEAHLGFGRDEALSHAEASKEPLVLAEAAEASSSAALLGGGGGGGSFAKRLDATIKEMDTITDEACERLVEIFAEGHVLDATPVAEVVREVMRKAKRVTTTMSEGDSAAAHKQAQNATQWFEMKLETTRTAATVQLKNQEVELAAEHKKQLNDALAEATRRRADRRRQPHEALEAEIERLQNIIDEGADAVKNAGA